ncbi:MAG: hypothetical protein GY838_13100 [bacterium]|nr:hypothetical protein [bacterium]
MKGDREISAAIHDAEEEKRLAALDPVARNIERIDAELARATRKLWLFERPEDAKIIHSLSCALAELTKIQRKNKETP